MSGLLYVGLGRSAKDWEEVGRTEIKLNGVQVLV